MKQLLLGQIAQINGQIYKIKNIAENGNTELIIANSGAHINSLIRSTHIKNITLLTLDKMIDYSLENYSFVETVKLLRFFTDYDLKQSTYIVKAVIGNK